MLEKLRKVVKDWFMETNAVLETGKEYKSVFELDGVNPSFNQFYNFGILIWKYLYRGFYSAWHVVPEVTISNPNGTRNMESLHLAKAVCSELAQMVWTDQSEIIVSRHGAVLKEDETDPLNDFVHKVLCDNNFFIKMVDGIEQASALGGEALKVWCEYKYDADGNAIPESERIKIGYCMADQFVPTAWDNAEITEGFFINRIAKDGYYYTKIEWHKWNGDTYQIDNQLYRASMKGENNDNQDILGFRYPLALIYPNIQEHIEFRNIRKSLFSYFKPAIANNIDDNSPLGISVYANAMSTLHTLDICFDSLTREFILGRKRIIVPARAIKMVTDPATGKMARYFDATSSVYEALNVDDTDSLKIHDNSVELRVEEHVSAINALLNIFCLQIGLSAGTFSFDTERGIKTATEVVSENSKTYKTIKLFQNNIKPAVERLVDNIIAIASLYEIKYNGVSVYELAKDGYHVAVNMDDGITQDRQTNIQEGITLVGAKLMSKYKFLTDGKYGQGLTPEEAKAELNRIAEEGKVNMSVFDFNESNTAE